MILEHEMLRFLPILSFFMKYFGAQATWFKYYRTPVLKNTNNFKIKNNLTPLD